MSDTKSEPLEKRNHEGIAELMESRRKRKIEKQEQQKAEDAEFIEQLRTKEMWALQLQVKIDRLPKEYYEDTPYYIAFYSTEEKAKANRSPSWHYAKSILSNSVWVGTRLVAIAGDQVYVKCIDRIDAPLKEGWYKRDENDIIITAAISHAAMNMYETCKRL